MYNLSVLYVSYVHYDYYFSSKCPTTCPKTLSLSVRTKKVYKYPLKTATYQRCPYNALTHSTSRQWIIWITNKYEEGENMKKEEIWRRKKYDVGRNKINMKKEEIWRKRELNVMFITHSTSRQFKVEEEGISMTNMNKEQIWRRKKYEEGKKWSRKK